VVCVRRGELAIARAFRGCGEGGGGLPAASGRRGGGGVAGVEAEAEAEWRHWRRGAEARHGPRVPSLWQCGRKIMVLFCFSIFSFETALSFSHGTFQQLRAMPLHTRSLLAVFHCLIAAPLFPPACHPAAAQLGSPLASAGAGFHFRRLLSLQLLTAPFSNLHTLYYLRISHHLLLLQRTKGMHSSTSELLQSQEILAAPSCRGTSVWTWTNWIYPSWWCRPGDSDGGSRGSLMCGGEVLAR
jgi:hypothetical protein